MMPVDHGNAVIDFSPIDEIVEGLGVYVRHGGDQAFYARPLPEGSWPKQTSGDYIQMPHRNQFTKPGAYYETLSHELAHASEVRLGVDYRQNGYAFGELVAELTASFVSSELGLEQGEPLENHAAYLKHWLEAMKGDTSFIFKAATAGSKSADFLLSFIKQPEPVIAD
jgi:antirestriction protein ArdC